MSEHDIRSLLQAARREAPPTSLTFEHLESRRRRRRAGRRLFAATLGIAAGAGALLITVSTFHGNVGRSPASGGSDRLPAAPQAPLVAGPGQSYYVKAYVAFPIVTGDKTGTTYEYHPYTIETWWGTDDSGRTVQTADRTTKDESYGPGDFPSDVSTKDFPTDPAELKQFLIDRSSPGGASPEPMFPTPPGGGSHDGQLWDVVSTIIDDPNMTPSVRAAVLEMAANLQSSQVDLTATDPGGRPAYRISVTQGGTLKELFVDPSTHELLAERNVRDGHLLWLYVEEAAGVADSTSAAPSQSSVPPPVTQPHVGIGGAGSG